MSRTSSPTIRAGPATTGPSGTYSVVGISPGKFPVRFSGCATAHAVAAQFYNDQPTEDSANQVNPGREDRLRHRRHHAARRSTDRGRYRPRGPPSAQRLRGHHHGKCIRHLRFGFPVDRRDQGQRTDLLRNVVPGPYQVSIGCYGSHFCGRWFNNQQDSARAGFLSIAPGLVTTLNGVVGQPGGISGNVTDQAGKPVSNVCVFIVDPKTSTYINRGGSFPGDGPPLTPHRDFQVRGLTPGRYLVDFVSSCAAGSSPTGGITRARPRPAPGW